LIFLILTEPSDAQASDGFFYCGGASIANRRDCNKKGIFTDFLYFDNLWGVNLQANKAWPWFDPSMA
jgi:hypothetical protein